MHFVQNVAVPSQDEQFPSHPQLLPIGTEPAGQPPSHEPEIFT